MKTYKLILKAPNCEFELMTRIVRAKDEDEARQLAANGLINDNIWLDREATSCQPFTYWKDDVEPN